MSAVLALTTSGLRSGYQPGIDVLRGIDLSTRGIGITAIIGPNGAGKSTLLRTIFGLIKPSAGSISLGDVSIGSLPPNQIKTMGMSYIAQGITIFPHLSVEENLRMGAWTFRGDGGRVHDQIEMSYQLFPPLADLRRRRAHELSGGQAKMLSIAKEVVSRPSILLVDEPTAGLSPALTREVYEFLLHTREVTGAAIVLVDQNIEGAIEISDYVYLLDLGRVRNEGVRAEFGPARTRELIKECLVG